MTNPPDTDSTADILHLLQPVTGYEFPITEEQAAQQLDGTAPVDAATVQAWLLDVLARTPDGVCVTITRAQAMSAAAALGQRAEEVEETRGCSCGMADYGAPGHEGHPDYERSAQDQNI